MDHIKFKYDYGNKFDSDTFITIRVDDPRRYQVGNRYKIIYPGGEFIAEIIDIELVFNLDGLPLDKIKLDTGLNSRSEFLSLMSEFYGDLSRKKWSILTLRRYEVRSINHTY